MSLLTSVLIGISIICAAILLVYLVLFVWVAKIVSKVFSRVDHELSEPTDHHRTR